MSDAAFATLDASLVGLVRSEVALAPYTTYRVGGAARRFVTIEHDEDLARVAAAVQDSGVEVLVVGKGSNLLVADRGFDGLAVTLGSAYAAVEIETTTVRAGAGAALPIVARRTAAAGLTGFEWAVGVPGSVGGAVRMNAGGHGSDMARTLRRIRVVRLGDGEDEVVSVSDLDLGYRRSALRAEDLVVWAELELVPGDAPAAEAEVSEVVRWRRSHQPGGHNAGSVFTNPAGDSAGRLIDAAGCKGLRIGTAEVSPKHANFIQADDGGSADDVWALMGEVRRRVADTSGVTLHAETRTVGFDQDGAEQ